MSAIDPVRAILIGNVASVAGRVYPVSAPQDRPLPAVVVALAREDDERTLQGAMGYPEAAILVDCLGDSYGAANALGDAVKAALVNYRGTIAGVDVSYVLPNGIDHFDKGDNFDLVRRRLGFDVRYRVTPADPDEGGEGD